MLRALPNSSYKFYVLGLCFKMIVPMVTAETNGYWAKALYYSSLNNHGEKVHCFIGLGHHVLFHIYV